MIKRQLNPLRIGKGLLCLIAMFVMLLAPQGAWAQDVVLTVMGQQFTADQLENSITLTGMTSGTATLTPATETTPVTLTFDNAQYDEYHPGKIVSNIDLKVVFIGTSKIYLDQQNDYAFEGNGTNTLTFENPGGVENPLTIDNILVKAIAGYWKSSPEIETNEAGAPNASCDWWLDTNTGATYTFKLMYNLKYDLWVKDTQVTSLNKNKVLGSSSSVSFEPASGNAPATLILYAYDDDANSDTPFITNGLSELNIKLQGNNQIHSGPLFLTKSSLDNTDNIVTFVTDLDSPGSLVIRAHGEEGAAWSSGHTVKYTNGLKITREYFDTEPYNTNTVVIEIPQSFDLTVAGTQVTRNNLSHILGTNDYSVTFDPSENKLYLDGATINGNIETSLTNLTISPANTNSIVGSIKYTGNTNTEASLTIDANLKYANSASLLLGGDQQEADVISGFSVTVKNPLEIILPENFTTLWEGVKKASLVAEGYDIRVGGVLVTKYNKENVMGTPDGTEPTVTYQPAGDNLATLTLNNYTIDLTSGEEYGVKYWGTTALSIKLKGTNSIRTQSGCEPILYDGEGETKPTLTFVSGSLNSSLKLETSGYTSVIKYFDNVLGINGINDGTGDLYIIPNGGVVYGNYSESPDSKCLYTLDDQEYKNYMTSALITSGYGITVAGNLVHEDNADNILDDELGVHMVTYNATSNTLKLTNATLVPLSDNVGSNIVVSSSVADLTIDISGENVINGVIQGGGKGLTFTKAANAESASLRVGYKEQTPISGFSDIPVCEGNLVYLDKGSNVYIQELSAPQMNIEEGETATRLYLSHADIEFLSGAVLSYSISYPGEQNPVEGTYDTNSNGVALNGPCTVTATITYNGNNASVTGRYFGFADIETVYSANKVLNAPSLLPTVEGLTIYEYSEGGGVANFDQDNGNININGVGATVLTANFTYSGNDVVLNTEADVQTDVPVYRAKLNITILPPAPTIAFDNTQTYLSTDYVQINVTLPENVETSTIYYSWNSDCAIDEGSVYAPNGDGVPLTCGVGEHTLYAWVKADNLYSEKSSQVFTVKTDIDELSVKDMLDLEQPIVYTGSAIATPFTLYDPNDETNTISTDNYDVKIEKNTGDGYSVVQSVKDAGEYMISAVAKGNTYGGEKIIYESLEVSKADLQGLPTVATDDLEYDGTEQVLLPITVPEGVTVEYFFTSITKEDYNNGSYDPNCAGEVTYSTNIPKATNAGYFAIIYKVNGGNNYNSKLPSETIKVAILPAAITEVTLSENTKEYNGQAQTVTIESVKADNLVLSAEKGDYSVSYEKVEAQGTTPVDAPLEVGNYNVIVTGEGNFTGSADATFTISDRTLVVSDVTFHNGWTTYYSADGNVLLPANSNVGAFVASGVGENSVTVTQISNIPEKVAVLLNNATTTTTTNVYGTDVTGNLLQHAATDVVVDAEGGDYYGLYNGVFMRVTDMFPADKNYLLIPKAVNVNTGAPQLNIVFDNEANMTGIDEVRSKMEDVRGDVYDLMGRKVQKPSKKGLYIQKGHKVVINK